MRLGLGACRVQARSGDTIWKTTRRLFWTCARHERFGAGLCCQGKVRRQGELGGQFIKLGVFDDEGRGQQHMAPPAPVDGALHRIADQTGLEGGFFQLGGVVIYFNLKTFILEI